MIERFRKVLVLGAHPDDEMACSGTIARLAQAGSEVHFATFSDCGDLIPEGFTVEDLIGEWTAATSLIGTADSGRIVYDIPNRHFPEHRQTILSILDAYRSRNYDLVLCPATFDSHQDHATVAREAIRVFKFATILGYELPMNEVGPLNLAGFVHLDSELVDLKVRHAATYRSQAKRPYMTPTYIRGLAAVRGIQAGCEWAEAFEVIRWHF